MIWVFESDPQTSPFSWFRLENSRAGAGLFDTFIKHQLLSKTLLPNWIVTL